jgi:myo-inositol-1(or 4)-monophosphatase
MLDIAIQAAREAGQFLKESVGKVKNVEMKKGEERNLVSEIDKGSEARIIKMIKGHYPHHGILAEESGGSALTDEYRWIIDPLDGTTNFLHGVPIFSVTIAVERKGTVIAGVTYDPNLDELYTAEQGGGAYMNGARLKVSGATEMINSLFVTGFPYDIEKNPDHPAEHFVNFLSVTQGVRRLGSAALDLAYVAAGRFDAFWEVALNPWDMAAGALFVNEAGGRTTDFTGAPLDIYGKRVLASNGLVHRAALEILAKPYHR